MTSAVAAIVSFLLFVAGTLTPSAAYGGQSRADSTRTVSALNATTRATLIARWILGPQAFRDVVPLYAYDLMDVCPLFLVGAKAAPRKGTEVLQEISAKDRKESPQSPRKEVSKFDVKIATSGKDPKAKDPKASLRKDPKASLRTSANEVLRSGEVALVTASRDRGDGDSTVWVARSVDGMTIMSLCENGPRAGAGFVAREYPLPYLDAARMFVQN